MVVVLLLAVAAAGAYHVAMTADDPAALVRAHVSRLRAATAAAASDDRVTAALARVATKYHGFRLFLADAKCARPAGRPWQRPGGLAPCGCAGSASLLAMPAPRQDRGADPAAAHLRGSDLLPVRNGCRGASSF